MSPVHALLGLQIVRRGLLFIDLAVAHVAALGMSLAIALGHDAQSAAAYQYSVAFALGGAMLIAVTSFRLNRVPHEAIIGIVYVLCTAASIVILEFAPSGHGLEELKGLLAGNILFVTSGDLASTAITYGVILAVALVLWGPITRITERQDDPGGIRTVLLDFAFYALLGFVVASSVKIAGVLVVFSWLVVPAVVASLFVRKMWIAACVAIPVGMIGSVAGLVLSFYAPALPFQHSHEEPTPIEAAGLSGWPTGPSIVVALGAIAIVAYLVRLCIPDRQPAPPAFEDRRAT